MDESNDLVESDELPLTTEMKIGKGIITFHLDSKTNEETGVDCSEYLVSTVDLAEILDNSNRTIMRIVKDIYSMDRKCDIDARTNTHGTYLDSNNQKRPMLLIDERMVILVIARLRGELAHRYMNDFYDAYKLLRGIVNSNLHRLTEESIQKLRDSEYGRDLMEKEMRFIQQEYEREILHREQENNRLGIRIEEMIPGYQHGITIMQNIGNLTMTEWALHFNRKGIAISNHELLAALRTLGYIQQKTTLAYHSHVLSGSFNIVQTQTGAGVKYSTSVTQIGFGLLTHAVQKYFDEQ